MNKRIAIAGTHSSGKSTILNELKKILKNYEFIDEVARKEIKIIGKTPQSMTDTEYEFFQRKVLAEQIRKESLHTINNENFISDRSVFDILAYSENLEERVYDILYNRVAEYLKHMPYTVIFYIPPEIELEDDGIRNIDLHFRDVIDKRIKKLLLEFNIEYIELTGSVEERLRKFLQTIEVL